MGKSSRQKTGSNTIIDIQPTIWGNFRDSADIGKLAIAMSFIEQYSVMKSYDTFPQRVFPTTSGRRKIRHWHVQYQSCPEDKVTTPKTIQCSSVYQRWNCYYHCHSRQTWTINRKEALLATPVMVKLEKGFSLLQVINPQDHIHTINTAAILAFFLQYWHPTKQNMYYLVHHSTSCFWPHTQMKQYPSSNYVP